MTDLSASELSPKALRDIENSWALNTVATTERQLRETGESITGSEINRYARALERTASLNYRAVVRGLIVTGIAIGAGLSADGRKTKSIAYGLGAIILIDALRHGLIGFKQENEGINVQWGDPYSYADRIHF